MGVKDNGRKKWWTPAQFWKRVIIRDLNQCWLWQGGTNKKGYGRAWDGRVGKLRPAHVVAYELHFGRPVGKPMGLHILVTIHPVAILYTLNRVLPNLTRMI